MEPQTRVVQYYLDETPESLYRKDQLAMRFETERQNLDPRLVHLFDKAESELARRLLS